MYGKNPGGQRFWQRGGGEISWNSMLSPPKCVLPLKCSPKFRDLAPPLAGSSEQSLINKLTPEFFPCPFQSSRLEKPRHQHATRSHALDNPPQTSLTCLAVLHWLSHHVVRVGLTARGVAMDGWATLIFWKSLGMKAFCLEVTSQTWCVYDVSSCPELWLARTYQPISDSFPSSHIQYSWKESTVESLDSFHANLYLPFTVTIHVHTKIKSCYEYDSCSPSPAHWYWPCRNINRFWICIKHNIVRLYYVIYVYDIVFFFAYNN